MKIIDWVSEVLIFFNNYVSDYIAVFLLLGTGIYFSIKTRFVQIRCFKDGMRFIAGGLFEKKSKGKVSPFSALATAVGAEVGTGNIIGAAAAILIGGPGAVFWMWVAAFFGMATVYAEAVAAQKTRVVAENGEIFGGPVFYIKKAFKGSVGKFLAGIFALSAVLTLGFSGAMVQSNAVSSTLFESYGISPIVTGLVLAVVCLIVFSGGIGRIAKLSEKLVVIMTTLFLGVCIYVLVVNFKSVPDALNLIIKSAFVPNSVIGGGVGTAFKLTIGQGVKKGIFSNEAGMGTTPHIHAAADAENPHKQGVVAMMGVFIDTFVILTITALVMLSVLYNADGSVKTLTALDMNNMMLKALSKNLSSHIATVVLSLAIFLFGFSSIISWNYFGRVNAEYLWGRNAVKFYFSFSAIFVFLGTVFKSDFVWLLTDALNIFLIIPNVIALIILQKRSINDR